MPNEALNPPVYVEPLGGINWDALKQSDGVIQDINNVDEDVKGRALNTLMDDENNKKLMKEHIEKLAKETLDVKQAFQDIASLLLEFDSKRYSDASGNPVPAQLNGWKGLSDVSDEVHNRDRSGSAG